MLPASNKGVGMNMGFPDVCLTPAVPAPVPIPYPNMAMNAMAVPFCPTILLSMMPALNMGSMIPMTLGMQPGVANPLYMQLGAYTMGNPKIILQGLPAVNLTCPTTGNAMNNPVGAVLVPSVTNVFFTRLSRAAVEPTTAGWTEVRRAIEAEEASTCAMRRLGDEVVYLRLAAFTAGAACSLFGRLRAVEGSDADDATCLILDLRGNPGGELDVALRLAGDFLDPPAVVATIVDLDGDETIHRVRAPAASRAALVLLVDGETASAAELFAGSLRAHGRAVLVGERTYGKASSQALVASPTGAAVYGTVARFVLPDGQDPEGVGVDVQLPFPGDDVEAWRRSAAKLLPAACVEPLAALFAGDDA